MAKIPRKIVQIAHDNEGFLTAVANDGTAWWLGTNLLWNKYPQLPDAEVAEPFYSIDGDMSALLDAVNKFQKEQRSKNDNPRKAE